MISIIDSIFGEHKIHERALRFVILRHQSQTGEHWDVMLETDSALTTWSIPPQCPSGASFTSSAIQLTDHRKHYLDYEGEIGDNRGVVSRINGGTYRQLSSETFILLGDVFSGKLTVENEKIMFDSC